MKKTCLLATVCFALSASYAVASDEHPYEEMQTKKDSSMPMHDKEKCDMMSKMKSEKMKQMKQSHMQAVEKRLANIEDLLRQLVELQKQKDTGQPVQ